jgi:hypothetical protein
VFLEPVRDKPAQAIRRDLAKPVKTLARTRFALSLPAEERLDWIGLLMQVHQVMMRITEQHEVREAPPLVVAHALVIARPVWICGADMRDLDDEVGLTVDMPENGFRAPGPVAKAATVEGEGHDDTALVVTRSGHEALP